MRDQVEQSEPKAIVVLSNNDWQIIRLALVNSELAARAILPVLHRLEEELKQKHAPGTDETPDIVRRMVGGDR